MDKTNSHLDIFMEIEDCLVTYEVPFGKMEELISQKKILCSKKKPHRKLYLDYEGEISNGRGILKIIWKGFYTNKENLFPENAQIQFVSKDCLCLEI